MKVSILTLGCKVNQSESSVIEGNLRKLGYSIVSLSERPDYSIINTCTVTSKSDYQSRQLIRRSARTGAKVIVTGCYSQLRPEEIIKIEGVIAVVDNSNKYNIIDLLTNNLSSVALSYSNRSRPYVKIQDGCNNSCTYCIVPKARGRSKSIDIIEVLKQACEFESAGYNEIVLTGIDIGSYGYDLKPKVKLSELIKTLLLKTRIKRIRLSSIEIKELDTELIELLQEQRICKHMHLPLQSGDDNILKLMNRMYTSKEYISVVERIVKKIPEISIGTDVIVGFPGEGEKEFIKTKNLIDSLPISYMHIFPFSSRPNTLAYKMNNLNDFSVKRKRFRIMNALNIKKKKDYMSSQINRILDVILEEHIIDNLSLGTSSNYLKVKFPSNGYSKRSQVFVRVSGIEEDKLRGNLVEIA